MSMEITAKNDVDMKSLFNGYQNNHECEANSGVYAYGGKLCVRPEYQRSFVYGEKESTAVISTILQNRPLGLIYWCLNQNNNYDCMDGQQRTISACDFAEGTTSIKLPWLAGDERINITILEHKFPKYADIFWNYKFMVQICEHGSHDEILDWFKTINIQGKELTDQELRNVNYTGKWLTDAKYYFSKSSKQGSCPAEKIGGAYTSKDANRQLLLEQVLKWIISSKKNIDICDYMENHYKDTNALPLWNYFNDVVTWAGEIFPTLETRYSKKIEWGFLYNLYRDEIYDPDEMTDLFNKMLAAKTNGELLHISEAKIIEYCFSRDESLLSTRTFTDNQRTVMYNNQHGLCGVCGKHYELNELHAHHKKSWRQGGMTSIENGILLCPECHHKAHNE